MIGDERPLVPLRCLLVVPSLIRGGAERQAILIGQALRECGLESRLFVQSSPRALFDDGLVQSLPVDLPAGSDGVATQLARLRDVVDSFAPDAVVTFLGGTVRFGLLRAMSPAARRAAWIITARGNIVLRHLLRYPARFAAHAWWNRHADRIVVNSSGLAGNLYAMLGLSLAGKVVVVPNILTSFDSDVAAARARVRELVGSKGGPIVGCIGSFQVDRNYGLLAEALPLVLRAYPETHLLVLGRNTGSGYAPSAAAFRARIAELGLDGHVTLAGEVQNGRVLLPALDVFAVPSGLEGSSNALAEAIMMGAAVASVPVADARELVGEAGVLSAGWTASAFAAAIVEALDNAPALRERAAGRRRLLVLERSSKAIGAQWATVIREAVAVASAR